MRKIINGRLYDTNTAKEIGIWNNNLGRTDFKFCYEILFQKKNDKYFLYGSGGAMSKYAEFSGDSYTGGSDIIPLSEQEAKKWAENHLTAEKYMEIFGYT